MRALAPLPPGSPRHEDGFLSPAGVTVAYEEDWARHHVLEGDGLCPMLYHYLHKNTKGREHTLSTVRIPETVVFDHNFPRAWFTYDAENRTIAKRSSKMLDAQTMYEYFSKSSADAAGAGSGRKAKKSGAGAAAVSAASRESEVVAQFFYTSVSVEEEWRDILTAKETAGGRYAGQLLTYVRFLTPSTLHDFLFQRSRKPDGVLQKFVLPMSEGTSRRNSQLQVHWSPLLTTVYRRTNQCRLDDTAVPIAVRTSTYDGPRWCSEETMVADESKMRLTALGADIADHFYATEGKRLTRLTLYFKMDDANRPWLLWCGCVRVAADSLNPSFLRVPPAFDMRTEVVNDGGSTVSQVALRRQRQKDLLALDNELFGVTHDLGFAVTVNASHRRQATALDMKGMPATDAGQPRELSARESSPAAASTDGERTFSRTRGRRLPAFDPRHALYASYQRVWDAQDAQAALAAPGATSALWAASSASERARTTGTVPPDDSAVWVDDASTAPARVQEELVALAMDAWYAVYSTTLSEDPQVMPTRHVVLAEPLRGVLSEEEQDMLTHDVLGLVRERQDAAGGAESPGAVYTVAHYLVSSGRRLDRPSAQVEKEVADFFMDVFALRGAAVVRSCLTQYPAYFEDA